ncbi:hypothetical protein [Corynebacterium sp.]|uniref:hypothetical protein n=1 Tax=Corynebacterium sp. TaxID=1720 RepID=UPI003B3B7650
MNSKARLLAYIALLVALVAVLIENPTSWVLIPLVLAIVASVAVDVTSRKGEER